jgi:hypothetical protein
LFNELRKKEITQSINIEEDLAKKREPGYWWEYYYDNVAYFDVYKRIEAYFDFVLSINYELFSQQTDIVMNRILEFLGIEKQTEIDYVRYNSSSEANIVHKLRSFMWLASVVPWRLRALLRIYIRRRAGRYASLRNNSFENNLIFSMDQYDSFRNYVNHKDIICIMK